MFVLNFLVPEVLLLVLFFILLNPFVCQSTIITVLAGMNVLHVYMAWIRAVQLNREKNGKKPFRWAGGIEIAGINGRKVAGGGKMQSA